MNQLSLWHDPPNRFPTGIAQCKLSFCLCHYLALVAQFQHIAMYHLIIYTLLASYLLPQLPPLIYWNNCFFLDERLIIIAASLQGSAPAPREYNKVLQVPPHLQMVFFPAESLPRGSKLLLNFCSNILI